MTQTTNPLDFTSNCTRYAVFKQMTEETLNDAIKMLEKPVQPFTGQIVLVEDDKIVVDKKSGISYCTKKTWDGLRSQFKEPT